MDGAQGETEPQGAEHLGSRIRGLRFLGSGGFFALITSHRRSEKIGHNIPAFTACERGHRKSAPTVSSLESANPAASLDDVRTCCESRGDLVPD